MQKNWRQLIVGTVLLLGGSAAWADSVFIGMTPTEFSEGFNRAAQIYRLKPRMPLWPAKAGKFSATVAPGITVSGVGVDRGDGMGSIRVTCHSDNQCNEAFAAAALSADPELPVDELRTFVQKRFNGELSDTAYMTLAGLKYALNVNKAKKLIELHIEVAPDEEE